MVKFFRPWSNRMISISLTTSSNLKFSIFTNVFSSILGIFRESRILSIYLLFSFSDSKVFTLSLIFGDR